MLKIFISFLTVFPSLSFRLLLTAQTITTASVASGPSDAALSARYLVNHANTGYLNASGTVITVCVSNGPPGNGKSDLYFILTEKDSTALNGRKSNLVSMELSPVKDWTCYYGYSLMNPLCGKVTVQGTMRIIPKYDEKENKKAAAALDNRHSQVTKNRSRSYEISFAKLILNSVSLQYKRGPPIPLTVEEYKTPNLTTLDKFAENFNRRESALMARYMVNQADWTALATLSTDDVGYPYVSVISISDGPVGSGTGVIYFMFVGVDVAFVHYKKNNRASMIMALAQGDYCTKKGYDPMQPVCGRVTFTGTIELIPETDIKEFKKAEDILKKRHKMLIEHTPSSHKVNYARFQIKSIVTYYKYGGRESLKPEEYYAVDQDTLDRFTKYFAS